MEEERGASIARKTHRSELDHRASPSRILDPESISQLRRIFATTARVSGSTHKFYLYPARFPPDVANEIIRSFSRKGEWILDPFMGGGTSAVEALTLGRQMLGSDINALAKFVADVRTRPLSPMDQSQVRLWATTTADRLTQHDLSWVPIAGIVNLPNEAETFFAGALELARNMLPRRRAFARGVLLRLGQLTLDCRDCVAPNREHLAVRLLTLVEQMFSGLDELVESCRASGVPQNAITGRRLLLDRSAIGLEEDRRIQHLVGLPRLVFTSPPYPGVHLLYHRWQYRGRRETSAPYWIANVADGFGASHYCGGSRTPFGLNRYFQMILRAFTSIRRVMDPTGRVVQIVGFSEMKSQLPAYLGAMEQAGFRDVGHSEIGEGLLQRRVANRKWYAQLKGEIDASNEVVLVHRVHT